MQRLDIASVLERLKLTHIGSDSHELSLNYCDVAITLKVLEKAMKS